MDCSLPASFVAFSRQEYWSGLPGPPSGDLPNPGMEPRSPTLQADCLISEPPGKPVNQLYFKTKKFKTKVGDQDVTVPQLSHDGN